MEGESKNNMTMTMTMHERDIIMANRKNCEKLKQEERKKQTKLMNVGKSLY